MLDYEKAKRTFRYEPETGKLFWAESRPREDFATDKGWRVWTTRFSGKEIVVKDNRGYIRFGLTIRGEKSRLYRAHRVIWLIIHGEWPIEIDHINGVRDDNRMHNLRSVDHPENLKNMSMRSNNTSGVVGVHFSVRERKWQAYISVDKKRIEIGNFTSKSDAISARKASEVEHGFHAGHGKAACY